MERARLFGWSRAPRAPGARRAVGPLRACRALPQRLRRGVVATTLLASLVVWIVPERVLACGGTPPPPVWGRLTALIKLAPAVFPLAGAGGPAVIPTFVFIGATGIPGAPCTPVSTTVTLTLACIPGPPAPPGAVIGATVAFPTPAPGFYFIPVPVVIPAGPLRICALTGTATTTWANGATSTGVGDIEICIVDEAPGMPGVPRLDLQLITPAVQTAAAGDQRVHSYLLTNNDPNHSVVVTLEADSEQTADLPAGSAEPAGSGAGTYTTANPHADNFPVDFMENLLKTPAGFDGYVLDDGTREQNLGTSEGAMLWLNRFTVQPGQEWIDRISVAYGTGANDRRVSVLVYDDPDNDGDPTDAVLLTRVDTVAENAGTNTFNETLVPATNVGVAGDSYFAGVVMQDATGALPGALDNGTPQGRSWFVDSSVCRLDVLNLPNNTTPPIELGSTPFPGNWMIRTHGGPEPLPIHWVELGDPFSTGIPTITREIELCPGESRVIEIATRSWPLCIGGQCEQRVRVGGVFSNGDPALACAAAGMAVDNSVPPDFACPDGGALAPVQQAPNGYRLRTNLPTHVVDETVQLGEMQVIPQDGPPLVSEPPVHVPLELLKGRLTTNNYSTPPLPVDSFFDVFFEISMDLSSPPPPGGAGASMLSSVHVYPAATVTDGNYFTIKSHSDLVGGVIPPTLQTGFDAIMQVSAVGMAGGSYFRNANIDQGSVNVQIVDPTRLGVAFRASIPSDPNDPGGPPAFDVVQVSVDLVGAGVGLPNPCPEPEPCPWDVNGDGFVDLVDLSIQLSNFGTVGGATQEDGDVDGDGDVDLTDLALLLANFGQACP